MRHTRLTLATLGLLASLPALAHTGHDHAFTLFSGLSHPVAGLDHLLAMLAVGLWAAKQPAKAWLAPATFMISMLAGSVLAALTISLPLVESGIALSVLVLGLMVAGGNKTSGQAGLVLIAAFALLHGHAHGSEAPGGSLAIYMLGFLAATGLLHLAGLLAGQQLQTRLPRLVQLAGAAIAACGAAMLTGLA